MNRRGFFGWLGGVAAVPLIAKLPAPTERPKLHEDVISKYVQEEVDFAAFPVGGAIRVKMPQRFIVTDGFKYDA